MSPFFEEVIVLGDLPHDFAITTRLIFGISFPLSSLPINFSLYFDHLSLDFPITTRFISEFAFPFYHSLLTLPIVVVQVNVLCPLCSDFATTTRHISRLSLFLLDLFSITFMYFPISPSNLLISLRHFFENQFLHLSFPVVLSFPPDLFRSFPNVRL